MAKQNSVSKSDIRQVVGIVVEAHNYSAFFAAVKAWQRASGATCTICWQDNMHSQCHKCGWWGCVAPKDITPATEAPKITDFVGVKAEA